MPVEADDRVRRLRLREQVRVDELLAVERAAGELEAKPVAPCRARRT